MIEVVGSMLDIILSNVLEQVLTKELYAFQVYTEFSQSLSSL